MTTPVSPSYPESYLRECAEANIEPGTCFCGCREKTTVAPYTLKSLGMARWEPFKYIRGHQNRKHHLGYEIKMAGYETPCWIWLRGTSKCSNGIRYGLTRKTGTTIPTQAHREVWERHRGPIPEGLELDHLCPNKLCVNPDHLDPKSHEGNMQVGKNAKLTEDQVKEIRRSRDEDGTLHRVMAVQYGVHPAHISRVCSKKVWPGTHSLRKRRATPATEADMVSTPAPSWRSLVCPKCGNHKGGPYAKCRVCWIESRRNARPIDAEIYIIDGARCRKIPATKEQWFMVEENRYEEILQEMWQAHWSDHSRKFYIGCARLNPETRKQYPVRLSNVILRMPNDVFIKHVNGNTLDFRASNLRVRG